MAEDIGGGLVGLARRQGISEMLHRTAARVPGKLAIVNSETRLTFAELEAAVSRTAAALAALGLRKGTGWRWCRPIAGSSPGCRSRPPGVASAWGRAISFSA